MLGAIIGDIEEAAYAYLDEPLKDVLRRWKKYTRWRNMDEVVELLSDVLSELRDMNEKIDELIEYHSGDCERNDVLEELK